MKRITAFLMVLVLLAGIIVPSTSVDASTVKVKDLYTGKTTALTTLQKDYLYVNGQKINMKNIPIIMRSGAYMGSVAKIFKNSTLNVKLSDYKENGKGHIKLTYGKRVLIMKEGSSTATLNGTNVSLPAIPFRAYYTNSKATRWVVPLWSVCNKLGITYKRGSDGVIRITGGNPNNVVVEDPVTPNDDPREPESRKGKIVVVIDAGHGGSDSGAMGNGHKEKNLTLSIVLAAKKYFDTNSRFKVYYTRTADTYPSLTARSDLANSKDADMFLCIHINSFETTSRGTETLYNANRLTATKKNGFTSRELAQAMQKAAVSATGFTNRGLVNRTGLSVLNKTKMPACLIEYGFISNPTEAASMSAGTARYGQALYNATVEFCKAKGLY